METLPTQHQPRPRRLQWLLLALLCMGGFAANAQTYCNPSFVYGCQYQDDINSLVITGAGCSLSDLNTSCNNTSTGITYRYPTIGIQNMAQTQTYSGYTTATFGGGEYFAIWIDFNNDGLFNNTIHSAGSPTGEKVVGASTTSGLGPYGGSTVQNFSFTIAPTAALGNHRMRAMVQYGSTFDACGTGYYYGEVQDYLVNIFQLTPCSGAPNPGTISPASTTGICPGTSYTINAAGYSLNSALAFQWMYSINGGTTWMPVPANGNGTSYVTGPITQNVRYHLVVTCLNTNQSDSSNNAVFSVLTGFPTYAGLPFFESFENWSSGCANSDLPSINWTNQPKTGDASWRREDQGSTANWTNVTYGAYAPAYAVGQHSARFHATYSPGLAGAGVLSAYVNCSATAGTKELQFYLRTDPGFGANDSVYVDTSLNGGLSFGRLAQFGPGSGGWDFKTLQLASNSATTVIRWTAWMGYLYNYYTDMGLDGVRVLPPCSGKPVAGKIDSVKACPGKNFTLSLTGTSQSAGLAYQWQYKPTGSTLGWANLPGGTIAKPTANISVPTSFRVIVTCTNSTAPPAVDDTSAVFDVSLDAFYYCYCDVPTTVQYPYNYSAIGNVSVATRPAGVTLMSNTTSVLSGVFYTSYAKTVPAPTLIRDSTYRFSVTPIYGSTYPGYYYGGTVAAFLDSNRNGIFDLPGERIMNKTTSSGSALPPASFQDVKIASNNPVGLTGLRAIIVYPGPTGGINPCGAYSYQPEVEDYLVYIEYQPCNGPVNPGTAYISDTSVCPGYTVDLWDTSYEKQRTGIVRVWQQSTNGGASYNNIAGSVNKDTLLNVPITSTGSTYGTRFRLAVICTNSGDTSYSNNLRVTNPSAVQCYPVAAAMAPGTNDSSDIGSFQIGPWVNPQPVVVSGPHLMNPAATRRRTDYTKVGGIVLAADSTYRVAVFHTMKTANHANAVVSVFIDFNNDLKYDINTPGYPFPSELIYRGYTTANNFYLDTFFKMPSNLIPNVPTGMRVVLNNDLNVSQGANNGNNGAGLFTSGEVEDYVITLTRTPLSVGTHGLVQNLAIFPNPTDAKATLVFDAPKAISHVDVVVTTITGQQVLTRSFDKPNQRFTTELDLSGKAKGIYFVEIRADGEKTVQKLTLR